MRKLVGDKLMKMRTRKKMTVRDHQEKTTVLNPSRKNARKSLQSRRTSRAE